MSLEEKIIRLTENVVLLTGKVEQRAKANEQSNAKATQSLTQTEQSIRGAASEIQRVTSRTVDDAIQKPVKDLDHSLKIIRNELIHVANQVQEHMDNSVTRLKHIT
ncbi:MAG: hypothetical protein ACRCV6_04840 [Formosimonas sp.]